MPHVATDLGTCIPYGTKRFFKGYTNLFSIFIIKVSSKSTTIIGTFLIIVLMTTVESYLIDNDRQCPKDTSLKSLITTVSSNLKGVKAPLQFLKHPPHPLEDFKHFKIWRKHPFKSEPHPCMCCVCYVNDQLNTNNMFFCALLILSKSIW